jgi:peroxiredoxin
VNAPDESGVRLQVGDRAPSFRVETLDGGTVTLDDLLGGRHLVLLFMREFT